MAFKVAATNPRGNATFDYEREALDGIGAEIVPVITRDPAEYVRMAAEMDAVMAGIGMDLNADVIKGLRRCKVIAAGGIGVDKIDLDAATECGIVVTNVPDVFTEEVADQAFTLLLAVNRKLVYCEHMATTGQWAQAYQGYGSMPKIYGKTLGLVAFGNIARAVARRAKGFGLNIIAYDPFVTAEQMAAEGVGSRTLNQVFEEADFVSAHVPHSAATHHILSAEQFNRMKPSAVFINTGRGRVVDEPTLIAALQAGKLAGAGLDVLEDEPPDPNNPLLHMDNVVVTPHMASYSNESNVARRQRVGEEIAAVLSGRKPRNVVNKAVLNVVSLA
jgi:D-3-phosphoglycerate dehydrogenase